MSDWSSDVCSSDLSIKDSESAWPKANAKPSSGGRLLLNDGKAAHKDALNLFLFSGFRFKANEQGYFDHEISPVVTTPSRYAMFSCKPNALVNPTCEWEPKTWQDLSTLVLVE